MYCIEHRVKIEEVVELLAAPAEESAADSPAPAPGEPEPVPPPLARIIALLRPPLPTTPGRVRRPPYKRRRA
jgi:hypothetical protein